MKKTTRSVTAFILTLMLIMAFPAAAFATDASNTIEGTSDVNTVTLEVLVPSSLAFALDPLGLNVTGENQISTQNYYFVNQTFAPVKVSVAITAETSGGAVLVTTSSGLDLNNTNVKDKELFFGALGATDITNGAIDTTATGGAFSETLTGPAAYYASATTGSATLVPFTPNSNGSTGSAVIAFALAEATPSATTEGAVESLATDNDGIAAFQFFSQLNTYANWETNDIKVSGTYTLTPLRDTTYNDYSMIGESLNQLVPEVETPEEPETPTYSAAGFIVSPGVTATTHAAFTVSRTATTSYEIPFYFNGKTITSLVMNGTVTIPVSDYSISGDKLVLVKDGGTVHMFDKAAAGIKTMVLTLNGDSTSYTFTVDLTT